MHQPDLSKWLTTAYLLAYQFDEEETLLLDKRQGWRQRLQAKFNSRGQSSKIGIKGKVE
ncbi:hypothetical protein [Chroococcidiopsis sp. TS-821]|uniref:hypothetical protein n=1 Tax=Chroococcidiopsis sp. TS-821 TaxID=1378066 RepID=UPI00143D23C0|nr:hypothetical protein [Chroococcidiopsis sp. TS-821]